MTEWALIIMLCGRSCVPQYTVVYPNKATCQAHMIEPQSRWSQQTMFCVPVIKEGQL